MFTFSARMSPLAALAVGGGILVAVAASSRGEDTAPAASSTAIAGAPVAGGTKRPVTADVPAPLTPVVSTFEPETSVGDTDFLDQMAGFFAVHLEVGAGMASFSLSDNKGHGRILGTIDELEPESDSFFFPVVGLYLNRYIGMECRYEKYEARTYTDTADNHSDGVVKVSGPVASLVGRLPMDTVTGLFSSSEPVNQWASRVVPFAGIGRTFFDESLDADPWWALGYSSPERYEEAGSPSGNYNGHFRSFKMSEQQSTTLLVGASILLGKSLSLNAAWTQADLDFDSSYYSRGQLRREGTIPFHYATTTIDLRYRF